MRLTLFTASIEDQDRLDKNIKQEREKKAMKEDRTSICEIISDMLDNPDKNGIYPTSTAFTRLEHYIERVRATIIGWTHGFYCTELDKGNDPRLIEIPQIYEQAKKIFSN